MTTRPTQGGKKRIANPAANDDRISPKLIGSIVSVGSLAFIGILTETVMTVPVSYTHLTLPKIA